ncbi:MAG: lipopolysaccharide biosynthesis protein [Acidobacteriota bacterium]
MAPEQRDSETVEGEGARPKSASVPEPLGAEARWRRLPGVGRFLGPGLAAVVLRGASGTYLVSVGGTGLALLLHALLARWLGEAGYGSYAYALNWLLLLGLLARLGLDTAQVRFLAQYRVQQDWAALRGLLRRGDLLAAAAGLALGALGALALALLEIDAGERRVGWLACLTLAPAAVLGLRKGALQGLRQVVTAQLPEGWVRTLVLMASVIAVAVATGTWGGIVDGTMLGRWLLPRSAEGEGSSVASAVEASASPWWAMALYLLATVVALGYGTWALRRGLRRELPPKARAEPRRYLTRRWLRVSTPLLLVAGMRQLLNQTDVLLVGAVLGRPEAGLYFIAAKLSQLVSFGLNAANSIAAPLISETHTADQRQELQRVVTLAARLATLAAVVVAVGILVLRRPLLGLFGEGFLAAEPALWWLVAGQLVNAATGPVGQLLNMTGHQDANARILGSITLANLLLNLPAILAFGLPGAAAVTSALIAVKNLWTWWEVRRRLGVSSFLIPLGARSPSPSGDES